MWMHIDGEATEAMAAQPHQDHAPAQWHAEPEARVLDALRTSRTGLSGDEAARRLAGHGPNALPAAAR